MRSAGVILLLFLLGAFFAAGKAPAATTDDAAVTCYRGDEAFMLDVPVGWGNLRQTADELGLCAVLSPGVSGFHEAPAMIYQRVAEKGAGTNPIEELMANSFKRFLAAPGGDKARLTRGGDAVSESGLLFELRYLDEGPDGNEYDMIACHKGKNSIFIVVLTARTPEYRQRYLPDFMQALKSVKAYEVVVQGGS